MAERRSRRSMPSSKYSIGARSLAWIEVLPTNLRARFDAVPEALAVLHRWLRCRRTLGVPSATLRIDSLPPAAPENLYQLRRRNRV